MFGFVIERSHDIVIRYPVNYCNTGGRLSVVNVERVYRSELMGPVGLYLTRREYRNRLRHWDQNAWSWGCGTQDAVGEYLDDCRDRVEAFGFNSKIDRDLVRQERELLNA